MTRSRNKDLLIKERIYSGTVITIYAPSTSGTALIKAKISYIDKNGIYKEFNSGKDWTCGGQPAVTVKDDEIIPGLEKAEWINDKYSREAVCSFKIPFF